MAHQTLENVLSVCRRVRPSVRRDGLAGHDAVGADEMAALGVPLRRARVTAYDVAWFVPDEAQQAAGSALAAVSADVYPSVAWAGEGRCSPRRLGWWDTDLVDEAPVPPAPPDLKAPDATSKLSTARIKVILPSLISS